MRDTQNGMRLLRGRALATFPAGGYEAETIHLRRVLRDGVPVAWVPIPAIYAEEQSSFRAGRDSAKVLWAWCSRSNDPHRREPEQHSEQASDQHVAGVVHSEIHARQRHDQPASSGRLSFG